MSEAVDLTVQRRMKAKDRIIDELVHALIYVHHDAYRADHNDGELTISNEALARITYALDIARGK